MGGGGTGVTTHCHAATIVRPHKAVKCSLHVL